MQAEGSTAKRRHLLRLPPVTPSKCVAAEKASARRALQALARGWLVRKTLAVAAGAGAAAKAAIVAAGAGACLECAADEAGAFSHADQSVAAADRVELAGVTPVVEDLHLHSGVEQPHVHTSVALRFA